MQYVSYHNSKPKLLEPGTVESLYACARSRAQWGQLWSALTKRSGHLLALAEIDTSGLLGTRRYVGMQTVPIRHIRGSQGRAYDFDRDFNPLKDHTRERWLGIGAARERGTALPPVDLIQVGDVYFVQDGHHRISVARALGQQAIEAEVTVWKVTGPLPCETPKGASSHACAIQSIETKCVLSVHKLAGAVRMALKGFLVLRPGVDRV
jgi:hypothetical protein